MKYQFIPARKDVVTYGEVGDLFYIILNGTVDILIPKSKDEIEESEDELGGSSFIYLFNL